MGGNFNLHLPHKRAHLGSGSSRGGGGGGVVPKGCLAVKVGQEGEEQQRFVVPVVYFNHPLFMRLLKEAEEVYGFDQKGTITIPCHVEDFCHVRGLIDQERSSSFHHHHHHHHHHNPVVGCFRA